MGVELGFSSKVKNMDWDVWEQVARGIFGPKREEVTGKWERRRRI
jgi:hypothetical protein